MVAITYTRPVAQGASLSSRAAIFVVNLFGALIEWNNTRMTRNALSRLSDRELDDIGLVRGDIDDIR